VIVLSHHPMENLVSCWQLLQWLIRQHTRHIRRAKQGRLPFEENQQYISIYSISAAPAPRSDQAFTQRMSLSLVRIRSNLPPEPPSRHRDRFLFAPLALSLLDNLSIPLDRRTRPDSEPERLRRPPYLGSSLARSGTLWMWRPWYFK
jgi:hypothetical protein